MERYLYKFFWGCRRQGNIEGLFVATEQEIKEAIGKEVYFREVLGKHSEVYGTLDECDVTKLELDSKTVEKVTELLGDTWSGFNPLDYIQYYCNDCGCSYYIDEFNIEKNKCNYCSEEN